MALRFSSAHPLVWRTPDEVQFGIEAPLLRLKRPDARQHFLLGLLQKGISRPVLNALAAERHITSSEVDELLAEVTPALEHGPPVQRALEGVVVRVEGRGPAVPALELLLQRMGAVPVVGPPTGAPADHGGGSGGGGSPGAPAALGVLVSQFATALRRSGDWLRSDIPHLLLEFGDRSVRIGPMVVPGASACAACIEFARTDDDADWPAIASQLAYRPAPAADAVGASIAAGFAVSALREHRDCSARGSPSVWQSSALRVHGVGSLEPLSTEWEPVTPHPRCGCRSLPENARASALSLDGFPRPPRTGAVAPVLA